MATRKAKAKRKIAEPDAEALAETGEEEQEVEVIDTRLVDEACDWIRGTLEKTLFRGMTQVGEYVLKKFFQDSADMVCSRNPHKDASFRELVDRCGTQRLPVSRSWLNQAVNVTLQDRMMEGKSDGYNQLTLTHKVALLPLGSTPTVINRLAERTVKQELSTRQLKVLVAEDLEKQPKDPRGRKPKNPIVKVLDQTSRTFELDSRKKAFRKDAIRGLSDEEAKEVLKSAQVLIARLQALVTQLEGR